MEKKVTFNYRTDTNSLQYKGKVVQVQAHSSDKINPIQKDIHSL